MKSLLRHFLSLSTIPSSILLGISAISLALCLISNPSFIDTLPSALTLFLITPLLAGLILSIPILLASLSLSKGGGHPGIRPLFLKSLLLVSVVDLVFILIGYGISLSSTSDRERIPLKLLVFGIDGATFSVMEPMFERGELAGIKGVMEEGASGILTSIEPIISPVVWTDMATGVTPDRHGITGFHMSTMDLKFPAFWDILEEEMGYRIGIYRWLVTYPPREARGFIVPAWLARGSETTPPELSFIKVPDIEVSRKKGISGQVLPLLLSYIKGIRYGLSSSLLFDLTRLGIQIYGGYLTPEERFFRTGFLRAEIDSVYFRNLLSRFRPDVATFTFYDTDSVGHRYWKYMDPPPGSEITEGEIERYGEVVRDAYRLADRILQEILQEVDAGYILIVSDHGFGPSHGEEGRFLLIKTDILQRYMEEKRVNGKVYRVGKMAQVSLKGNPEEVENLASLFSQVSTGDGSPFFKISRPSHSIIGLKVTDAGYRAIKGGEEVNFMGTPVRAEDLAAFDEVFSGVHHPEGILALKGSGIKRGVRGLQASLTDIAPTILALMGLSPPLDMEGRVIEDIFEGEPPGPEEGKESFRYLVERLYPKGEEIGDESLLKERLRALGYVE